VANMLTCDFERERTVPAVIRLEIKSTRASKPGHPMVRVTAVCATHARERGCPETYRHDVSRHHKRAPNWTEVEKMSAGRRTCAPSQRPPRQDATYGYRKDGGK
jgi:hypothetical protein